MTTRRVAIPVALCVLVVAVGIAAGESKPRTFAGSIQLDYLAVPTNRDARALTLDGSTIELSLKLTAELSKSSAASVKVCFACHGFEAGMAFVELRASDELQLRIGRMTPSFGNFPQRHDPANHRTSDKPLPYDMGRMLRRGEWNESVLPAPWVDNGIELGGTSFLEHGQLDYAVFLMAGPKGGTDAADFDFIASRTPGQYYVDNNSQPIVGGRVAGQVELRGHGTLGVGASGMVGTYDPARELAFAIGGAELVLDLKAVIVRAEYLLRWTQIALGADPAARFKFGPDANGRFADYFIKDGFYVEGQVPIGPVDVLARWDGMRRKGNVLAGSPLEARSSIQRFTLGTAVKVGAMRIKSSVELYQFREFDDEVAVHLGLAAPF